MFAAQARCLAHVIHRTILSFLKEAELVCLFQKIQLACAPPSATIAGTKPSRQGKPICVPNERGRQHQHPQSCFLAMASALARLALRLRPPPPFPPALFPVPTRPYPHHPI